MALTLDGANRMVQAAPDSKTRSVPRPGWPPFKDTATHRNQGRREITTTEIS